LIDCKQVLLTINVMKRFLITSILAAMLAAGTTIVAQEQPDEYLGLPGDNFNLYAVMNLFQESETLEGFERSLNDENSRINNLDLNGDNQIDYIKVIDYVDGDVHNIVLEAILDRNESQDVAVFTVQRLRDGSVQIQLTGDEALYGKNYIIEPISAETPNPGYTGRSSTAVRTTYVEVSAWPVVRFIFLPDYALWHSSWYWGYYPSYWHPWRPYYWHYYYGYHYNWYPTYYSHFHRWDHHRYDHWNDFYYRDKRVYSRNVTININDGRYKNTYSHPEQRKEGEALYTQVHPERVSNTSSGNNTGRRSASQSAPDRQQSGATNGTTRRSTTTATEKTRTNSSEGQNNGAVNRSTTTVNNRANTNSTTGQSTVSNRRSSETVSSKPASRTESGKRTESARTSKQSSTSAGSSNRRSRGSSKSESTVKKSSTSKDSEKSNTSRRK
jgi:hypothetical protein